MFCILKHEKVLIYDIILLIANIYGQQNRTIGDINDDGEINVIDVVLLVSNILENIIMKMVISIRMIY